MILDELSVFARGLNTAGNSGTNYTDALDWGTGGNPLGSIAGAGHHGDDVGRHLSWNVWAETAVDGPIAVTWQTSGKADFSSDVTDLVTKTSGASVAKGDFLVSGEPLPKGLKRYNRLKVVSTADVPEGKVMAWVVDVRGA